MRESIAPRDEAHWLSLRAQDLTSTEVAALFGLSPYITEFELYHLKVGNVASSFELNDRSKWGQRLQDSIAVGIAEDQGWKVRKMTEYIRMPELRIGSSFDFRIQHEDEQADGLLEIKNVDALIFRDGWMVAEDKTIEAPEHIELQVQHQMLVSGLSYAIIGALIGGNRVILEKRIADAEIHHAIKAKVASFWERVDSKSPPEPDFHRDIETIKRLHSFAQPNKVVDVSGDERLEQLVTRYRDFGRTKKEAEDEQEAIKAEILTLVGDAEKAIGQGFTLSLGMIGEAEVAYTRKPYRMFKANFKKTKEALP